MKVFRVLIGIAVLTGLSFSATGAGANENALAEAKRRLEGQLEKIREHAAGRRPSLDWPLPGSVDRDRHPGTARRRSSGSPATNVYGGYPEPGSAGPAIDTEWREGILRPGEAFTYEGVTAKWVIPEATETERDLFGWLTFSGPSGTIDHVEIPVEPSGRETKIVNRRGETGVYLDGVAFAEIRMAWGPSPCRLPEFLAGGVEFWVGKQPDRFEIPGGPEEFTLYVSSLCPVTLNEWEIGLSDRPVEEVAGERFYGLTVRNTETGESHSMPLMLNLRKTFHRYNMLVGTFDPTSQTAALEITAEPDPKVRGRGAYIKELVVESETMGGLLERLGEEYGFEVEWVPTAGYPESVEYAKSTPVRSDHIGPPPLTEIPLEDVLSQIPEKGRHLSYEWVDDTHLRVWPTDYEAVVAEREQEARKETELKEFTALFQTQYTPETRIYQLERLSAASAREIVEQQLRTYLLSDALGRFDSHQGACREDEVAEFYVIGSCENRVVETFSKEYLSDTRFGFALRKTVETVIADERSNSVILTAVPKTHERIRELLAKMEGLLSSEAAAGPVERYRVEVVLLSGGQSVKESGIPLSFPIQGVVTGVPVKAGQTVNAGEILARLDSDDVRLRIEELKAVLNSSRAQLAAERNAYKRLELMFEKGTATQKEVQEAEVRLIGLELEIKVTETQLEQAQLLMEKSQLRAPETGTILAVEVQPNQRVEEGETVVVLRKESEGTESESAPASMTESHAAAIQRTKQTEELMENYGIAPGDLEAFGLETLNELGKGVVSLAAERGDTGVAHISLTEQYGCELEFQDVREPYVIIRGRLTAADREQPLIENTLYLEPDTPSMLGVTNLREGLILVARRSAIARTTILTDEP